MIEVCGSIFIIVLGILAHFIYEWSCHNKIIGYFVPVNESTFEHLKLVIGPSLLWFIVEIHLYQNNANLIMAKFISLCVMLIFIPLVFYTYTHFTKKPYLIVDIISFMMAVILGEYVFSILIDINFYSIILNHISYFGLFIIIIKYITSAYTPNKNIIYEDPLTKKYGVEGHSHHDHHEN